MSWSLQFVTVHRPWKATDICALSYPGLWCLEASRSLYRGGGSGSPPSFGWYYCCAPSCQAVFLYCKVEKYSPSSTSLNIAQSSGILKHLDILGHSSHPHRMPSKTNTGRETMCEEAGCLHWDSHRNKALIAEGAVLGLLWSWFLAVLQISAPLIDPVVL